MERNDFMDRIVLPPNQETLNTAKREREEQLKQQQRARDEKKAQEVREHLDRLNARHDEEEKRKALNEKKKRNIRGLAIIAATSLFISGIGIGVGLDKRNRREDSKSLETSILLNDIGLEEGEFTSSNLQKLLSLDENGNYVTNIQSSRPEIYRVLQSTDIDELIDNYILNPSRENLEKLNARGPELAKLPWLLYRAEYADMLRQQGKDVHYEDIHIEYKADVKNEYIHGHSIIISNGEDEILRAFKPDELDEDYDMKEYYKDFESIPNFEDLKKIIINANNGLENSSDFDFTQNTKKYVKRYRDFKKMLTKYHLALKSVPSKENKILCLEGIEDGKFYSIKDQKEISELNEHLVEHDEGR